MADATVPPANLEALDARLRKLERQNRRLRGLVAVVIAAAAVPLLAGYASPNDKIEATEFVVRDKAGAVRARLFVDEQNKTRLVLRDKDGKSEAMLVSGDGGALHVTDQQGKTSVVVTASSAKGVVVVESSGKPRAVLPVPTNLDWKGPLDVQDPWSTPD